MSCSGTDKALFIRGGITFSQAENKVTLDVKKEGVWTMCLILLIGLYVMDFMLNVLSLLHFFF